MKTYKVLLTASGLLLFALLVTFLFIMKNSLNELHARQEAAEKYEYISRDKFDSLVFSGNMTVKIRRGMSYRAEAAAGIGMHRKNGSVLFENRDTSASSASPRVRIIAPSLSGLRADGNCHIVLEGFDTDSMRAEIGDGVQLTVKNNVFRNLDVKTSGMTDIKFQKGVDFE